MRAQGGPGDGQPAHHHLGKVQLHLRPGQKGDLHQTPVVGQCLDVARQVRPADHVQDQVRPAFGAQDVDEILGPVVDRPLCAQRQAGRAFVIRPGGGKDPRPQGDGNLDGRRADAGRTAMHQKPLARPQAAAQHHVRPDGETGFRQTGRRFQIHPLRNRQGMGGIRHHIFGIAPARQQRTHLVADLPVRNARPHLHHHARRFQPRQGRGIGGRRIGPGPLQRIRAVHAGIGHADHDLAVPWHGHRHNHRLQHLRPAGFGNFHGAHRMGQGHGTSQKRNLPGRSSRRAGAESLSISFIGPASSALDSGLSRRPAFAFSIRITSSMRRSRKPQVS